MQEEVSGVRRWHYPDSVTPCTVAAPIAERPGQGQVEQGGGPLDRQAGQCLGRARHAWVKGPRRRARAILGVWRV